MKEVYRTSIDISETKERVEDINNFTSNEFVQLIAYVMFIPRALCEDLKERIE